MIVTPSGSRFWNSAATAFTLSTVSIRLAPVRLEISIATAGSPLSRVIEVASLKVGRTSATSRARTVALGPTAIGKFAASSIVSISAGTLTA